jgi:uncharacterized membrane-anchored protein YitT (DUF2179 family)
MMDDVFKNTKVYNAVSVIAMLISAWIGAVAVNMFILPGNMISGGFTGLAILLNTVSQVLGFPVSISLIYLLLNVPAVILCYRSISPRFTILSLINVAATSFFIQVVSLPPLFTDPILLVVFGGVLSGISTIIALKVDASTGGTDFVALYFSNRYGRALWREVFIFNACMIIVFGFTKGWINAGYSIVFQFVATKFVTTFHTRYNRVTLQIMTEHCDDVVKTLIAQSQHGITCTDSYGGYSHKPITMITTVVSSYQSHEIIRAVLKVDKQAIVNVVQSEEFFGKFVEKPY